MPLPSTKLVKLSLLLCMAAASFAQTPQTLGITQPGAAPVWNVPYASLTAQGGTAPYKWSLVSGTLPPGLTLSPTTADATVPALNGTPIATGSFTFTIKVSDSTPRSAKGPVSYSTSFTLNVQQLIVAQTQPVSYVGAFVSDLNAQGGTPPYTATISGTLPPGLTYDSDPGSYFGVSGSPTQTGTFNFRVQVTDSAGLTASGTFSMVVNGLGITVSTSSITAGSSFTDFNGQGGSGTYNWTLVSQSGALPAGLTLSATTPDSNGNSNAVNGIPTTPGTYTFQLTVTDATNSSLKDTQTFSLIVTAPPQLAITAPSAASINTPYNGLLAQGGSGPYTWTISGTLPSGITLDSPTPDPATNGVTALNGTPSLTSAGVYPIKVTVTDSTPAQAGGPLTASASYSFVVQGVTTLPAPQQGFVVVGAPGGVVGQPYGGPSGGGISAINGSGPYTWKLLSGVIPPGLSQNSQTGGQLQAFYLTGTPTNAGTWSFTVQITDSTPASSGGPLTTQQNYLLSVALASSFADASAGGGPWGITAGPDGNLWFSEFAQNQNTGLFQIGRITPSGSFLYTDSSNDFYGLPQVLSAGSQVSPQAFQLALAQDGKSVWFLEPLQQFIGQITSYGSAPFQYSTDMTVPNSSPSITAVLPAYGLTTAGPPNSDSAWVTLGLGFGGAGTSGILQVNSVDHSTNFFPVTDSALIPESITWNNADGAFWFTGSASSGGYIGRMTADGTMSPPAACASGKTNGVGACPVSSTQMTSYTGQQYAGITVGPDGQTLWFTDPTSSQIGSITPDGKTIALFTTPTGFSSPTSIVTGPDNALWFTEAAQIGRLDPATGAISEFPIANAQGAQIAPQSITSVSGSLWVTDVTGSIIQIVPPFSISCRFPNTIVGTPATTDQCSALGGTGPYSYSVVAGSLPPGLSGPNSSGAITGTPTLSGKYTFTIQATDSGSPHQIATEIVTITVTISPVTLTGCSFPNAAVEGLPYQNSNCVAAGGVQPYHFSVSTGSLPPGLSLSTATGVVSGAPSGIGSYSFTILLQDSGDANTPAQSASYAATLIVNLPPLTLSCDLSGVKKVGVRYSASCVAGNGVAPVTFSATGTLPPGLTLNSSSGVISGTPTAYGNFSFTIQVTDHASPPRSAQQSVTGFVVQPAALTITSLVLPNGSSGLPYSGNAFAAGGAPPFTWSVASGGLPLGLTLNAATGAVTGVPTIPGPVAFSLQVTDSTAATSNPQSFSITISGSVEPSFSEFPLPVPSTTGAATGADGIISGPDGNLWFTTADIASSIPGQANGGNLIGTISTAGVPGSQYPAPALLNGSPNGGNIVVGPDNNLWFTETDGNGIGQITTSGVTTGFSVPTAAASPQEIATGPDGALWFTESSTNKIGRITTGGTVTEYPVTTPQSAPTGIATGSDGALWFTEKAASKIGRIDPVTLVITEFSTPTLGSAPIGITAGPDDALWFTESTGNAIGRVPVSAQSGTDITEYPVPTAASGSQAITAVPAQGVLWFTELSGNQIGRITTNGVINEYPAPTSSSTPTGITLGPDGAIWFTENAASQIGRLALVPQLAINCNFPAGPTQSGTPYSGSCSASGGTAPYTFSVSGGTPPTGVTIDATSGALSGILTGAGTFTYTVNATDSGSPAQTASTQSPAFVVIPLPISLTCSLPNGVVGLTYSGSCPATQGTPPYTYSVVTGTLPAGLSLNPSTGAVSGIPASPGSFAITLQVTDSGTPAQSATASGSGTISFGTITGSGTPLFTLSGLPSAATADQNLTNVTLRLNEASPVQLTAALTLTFAPFGGNSGVNDPNLAPSYIDPALQFLDSNGQDIGTTYTLTIPAGATSLNLPDINPGTVAGTISLGLTMNGLAEIQPTAATSEVVVPAEPPVIEPGSVQISNVTAGGFDVEFIGYSSPRAATSATYVFNSASGSQLQGFNSFTVDVTSVMSDWYQSSTGLSFGSRFSLTMPFKLSGPISAIQSVTVTLSDSTIGTSAPVTGNR